MKIQKLKRLMNYLKLKRQFEILYKEKIMFIVKDKALFMNKTKKR